MFVKDDDYWKAKKESKDGMTKVIKVWSGKEEAIHDAGFANGAEFGFQKGIKAKINTTTISDCPIKDEWHYVKDGDLPDNSRYVWTNVGAGYHDADGWFDDFGRLNGVIAWCEPKFKE